MLVRELIQRVQSLYSKGVQSDDSRLTPRHIYNKLQTIRTLLITQKAAKKQKISQWNYQSLPCVELVKAQPHECPCIPPVGCTILRTKYELPKPLLDLNQHLIQSVTSVDGSVIYSEVSWNAKKYKAASKYTSTKPDYFIRSGYLYLTHKKGPKIISIEGLFEDPVVAAAYTSYCGDYTCEGNECVECISPLDVEFPIESSMIDTLIEMALKELIEVFGMGIEDATNDTRDTITEQSK